MVLIRAMTACTVKENKIECEPIIDDWKLFVMIDVSLVNLQYFKE